MTTPIKLYGNAKSGHCHRVELMLAFLDLPYETVDLDMANGAHKAPEFLKISSFGLVPAIDDGGYTLADSNAILTYLVQTYAKGSHWMPDAPKDAAEVQRWLTIAADNIYSGPLRATALPPTASILRPSAPVDRRTAAPWGIAHRSNCADAGGRHRHRRGWNLQGRDLLSLGDIGAQSVETLIVRAGALQRHWQDRTMPQTLQGRRVGMIEELPGWRNPTALAVGVAAMGGSCVSVGAKLEGAETVEDLAGYMNNWFDLIAVRTPDLSRLTSFARASKAPVMNLRTNDNHPCEVLGDLAYVMSVRGSLAGLRVAVVGPAGNIASSWFEAAHVLGIEVIQITPKGYEASIEVRGAQAVTEDLRAVRDADLIVTDCWPADLDAAGAAAFSKCRIDAATLDGCRADVLFVPCPPVTRGQDVSEDAMLHPACVATPAKAFLLHAQNAYLEAAIGGAGGC